MLFFLHANLLPEGVQLSEPAGTGDHHGDPFVECPHSGKSKTISCQIKGLLDASLAMEVGSQTPKVHLMKILGKQWCGDASDLGGLHTRPVFAFMPYTCNGRLLEHWSLKRFLGTAS